MWFFTSEQKLLQESVRDFAQSVLGPKIEYLDETEGYDRSYFTRMGELGLLGVTVPEKDGGFNMGCVAAIIAIEELAAVDASTALSYLAHSILCVHNLADNGSTEQKRHYLPKLLSGEWIGGLGMTEPGAGTDALGLATRAVRKDNNYVLNGSKIFITNAVIGDVFFCYGRTGEGKKDISSFIVESRFPGFRMGRKLKKMGMRASPTGELIFDNCEVPIANLVGKEGDSIAHMFKNLAIERIAIAGISLGIARASLEAAKKYAQERSQFGKSIGEFQMIQQMLADGQAEYEAAANFTYNVAKEWDSGLQSDLAKLRTASAKVKLVAARMATKVALDAVQILGGYGYTKEFPVERYARDAKLVEIGAGTNEILRVVIAKDMLG